MSTWLLVVWFASSSNYAYIASNVGEFPTRQSCEAALEKLIATRSWGPKGVCLEKPQTLEKHK